ncbi:hypothetical protein NJC10_03040 [Micrococcus sp. M4NT]|uniref:hypothetical protein n=1 Tax=Micrococcus sp. M4NT TaxID=2957501 RepID=UPI0029B6656A|nr:hypothetical protein [Micrococcus sp. M4NT]MDX2340654.1 hypothetical protein [Micrococcus sp. M4NT]
MDRLPSIGLAGLSALALAAGLTGCGAAEPAETPAPASPSTPATAASSSSAAPMGQALAADVEAARQVLATTTDPSVQASASAVIEAADASARAAAEADHARMFKDDGITYAEYAEKHLPTAAGTRWIVWEGMGTGTQSATVDAQAGDVLTVAFECPMDAVGKTDLHTTIKGVTDWRAGSDAGCGGWSAGLPPIVENGPVTLTATVANSEPFRMVVMRQNDGA